MSTSTIPPKGSPGKSEIVYEPKTSSSLRVKSFSSYRCVGNGAITPLESTYSHAEPVPYAGRGRPKNPIRVVDAKLKYAQVIKHKQRGRLVDIEQRVIRGTEEEILDIIRTEQRGQTIHTSYVESRNGNYRKDNKRFARRSACHSKEATLHDAQIDLLTGMYNFVDANQAFRQCINPNAKRFEVKYKQYSPAMLEGFTDCCLTLEELLMWRVPR